MTEKIEYLLKDIRSLLILQLIKSGTTSEEIGKCLGIKGSRVRQIACGLNTNKSKKEAKNGN